jgi:hypothetical protein
VSGVTTADDRVVLRLVGAYNADGSILGELRYFVGRMRGNAHCELCDVTHGRVRKKPEFAALQARSAVPFDLVHLDERTAEIAALTNERTPCVLAQTSSGYEVVLAAHEIAVCDGDVQCFDRALHRALDEHGLRVPAQSNGG